MNRRVLGFGAATILAVGGWVAAGKWNDHRMAACEQRGARFAALDLLTRGPDGYHPADSPAAGCDVDRVKAYASRQFLATAGGPTGDANSATATAPATDKPAVTAFYRALLQREGWHIANTADLCANKERASVNLSFPLAGAYELMVADAGCA